ncbi:hypothetical protein DL770_006793 [Monosporascus sp. CRB-9-2]|nr:hypothetical protein DL770_006793 [Monosporascus sp. CRB-9-2]
MDSKQTSSGVTACQASTRHLTTIALGSSISMGLWHGSGTSPTGGCLAGKLVNPAAAFTLSWSYWFSYCLTIANKLQAANTIIGFRTNAMSIAARITI